MKYDVISFMYSIVDSLGNKVNDYLKWIFDGLDIKPNIIVKIEAKSQNKTSQIKISAFNTNDYKIMDSESNSRGITVYNDCNLFVVSVNVKQFIQNTWLLKSI